MNSDNAGWEVCCQPVFLCLILARSQQSQQNLLASKILLILVGFLFS